MQAPSEMEEYVMAPASVAASDYESENTSRYAELPSHAPYRPSSSSSSDVSVEHYPSFPQHFSAHAGLHAPNAAASFLHSHSHPLSPFSAASCSRSTSTKAAFSKAVPIFNSQVLGSTRTSTVSEAEVSRQAFLRRYVSTLLPALRRRSHGAAAFKERLAAVKTAADMSLVMSAGSDSVWSRTLEKEVMRASVCRSTSSRLRKAARCSRRRFLHLKQKKVKAPVFRGFSRGRGLLSDVGDGHIQFAGSPLQRKARPEHLQHRRPRIATGGRGLSSYLRVLRATMSENQEKACLFKQATDQPRQQQPCLRDHQHGQPVPITKEQIEGLGRLVPGGRTMDVPLLLAEAADYIVALQMQIEAMGALASSVGSS